MKILHITDYCQPVMGYQEIFLAKTQRDQGHDVTIITSDRYSPLAFPKNNGNSLLKERRVLPGKRFEQGVPFCRLSVLFEIPYAIWLKKLEKTVRRYKPDIIIVHGIVSFSAIRLALMKLFDNKHNYKLIIDDHMTFANSRSKLKLLYPLFRLLFSKLIIKSADLIVAVGEPAKNFMHIRYGIPKERIKIISLAADANLFKKDQEARKTLRRKFNLNNSDTLIVYSGKISPDKRIEILIQAISLVNFDFKLNLLMLGQGSPSYIDHLKKQVDAFNLSSRVIWHDFVPNKELYRHYSAADLAVWPGSASISILEAMSCGLPVITSDSLNINEMTFVDNQLRYEECNPDSLAKEITKLLDPNLRRKLGRQGRKLIEDKLNWEFIAKEFSVSL